MNAVATAAGVVLGVSGKDLNELYDTTAAIEKLGNKNLVLDVTGADVKETFGKCCTGTSCSSERSGQNIRLSIYRKPCKDRWW